MVKQTLLSLFLFTTLNAKTYFYEKDIAQFCTTENPFFSSVVIEADIVKARELFYKGAFDTQLSASYEEKTYPLSTSSYKNIAIVQPLKNGVELSLQYRKADGVQEYNNIKTGKDGEVLATLLVPLNNLVYNTGKRDVNYKLAHLKTERTKEQIRRSLQRFYKDLRQLYYKVLYHKALLENEKKLLTKSKDRLEFIQKELDAGKRAPIEIIQNRHTILQREQRVLDATNSYLQFKKSFLTYLGTDEVFFDNKYIFPTLTLRSYRYKEISFYLNQAYSQRPELKELSYEAASIKQQKRLNRLSEYPKVNFKANQLYDIAYEKDGYKLTAELTFNLQRRQYKGENEKLQQSVLLLNAKKERLKETIKLQLSNILQNIRFLQQKKSLYEEEIKLAQILESAEKKRYIEGVGNLIFVNQREIETLQAKKKLLQNQLQRENARVELEYETGKTSLQYKERE